MRNVSRSFSATTESDAACIHPLSPLQGIVIVRVMSLKLKVYSASHLPTDCLSLLTWMTSSARLRGPCTPSTYCGLGRCSAQSSSLSLLTPLQRGGASRPPLTDSVSMLFCVELLGLTCGHWLGCLTRIRSRTSVTQLMINCSSKLEVTQTTFYAHFFHHHPLHHRTTVWDSAHTQRIFLTVISLCVWCARPPTGPSYCFLQCIFLAWCAFCHALSP